MTEVLNLGFLHRISKVGSVEGMEIKKEIKQLYEQRRLVREELETSMENYNHVTEQGLMDFYIYKIRAEQTLEQYLIREIRRLEEENKTA